MILAWYSKDKCEVYHICLYCNFEKIKPCNLAYDTEKNLAENSDLKLSDLCRESWNAGNCQTTSSVDELIKYITQ